MARGPSVHRFGLLPPLPPKRTVRDAPYQVARDLLAEVGTRGEAVLGRIVRVVAVALA